MIRLGVNIDHVATIRQAREGREPDPVWAAVAAELGGADAITVHLRVDRRHIQERDLRLLRETVHVPINLEIAAEPEMIQIALDMKPEQVTLVPERREEVTTEGGLDVAGQRDRLTEPIGRLRDAGIIISLFIDPVPAQVAASAALGVEAVELHTGAYAKVPEGPAQAKELESLVQAGRATIESGLALHAGHGLNYRNVSNVARIAGMEELHIGHSLVSRAVFVGLQQAVREMKDCLGRVVQP